MELRLLGLPKKSLQQAEKPFLPTLWAIVTDVLVVGSSLIRNAPSVGFVLF